MLVQSNYGGKLVIDGVPVWKELTPRADRQPAASTDSQVPRIAEIRATAPA